ncbi:MAG: flippase-like domain-containing protein [Bacteroidetes bacterium]|nr:flippase-like domain-containing protein [Bacteroidota bacterium]MCL5026741.1 flippase-like domain-containing protein [Chloroflexota bacterium]
MTVNGNGRSRWSLLVAFLLGGVLLFLAFRGVDWNQMLKTARQGRLDGLALAFVALTISYFLRGLRWRVLLGSEKRISPLAAFWGVTAGYLGNCFLPARAGELVRSVAIGRHANISKSYVLATALTERVMDVLALVLFSLAALTTMSGTPGWLVAASRVMAGLGLAGTLLLFMAPRMESVIIRALAILPLPGGLQARLVRLAEQFLLGMRAFQHPGRALSFAGLTISVWLIDGTVALLVAGAFSLALTLPQALLLLAALGLASAAPSTPGYVGIYQFVAVTVLAPLGFTQDAALVYITAFQAVTYAVVIVWGTMGLWQLNVPRPVDHTEERKEVVTANALGDTSTD